MFQDREHEASEGIVARLVRFWILREQLGKEGRVGMREEPMSGLGEIYAFCSVRRDIWECGLEASTASRLVELLIWLNRG